MMSSRTNSQAVKEASTMNTTSSNNSALQQSNITTIESRIKKLLLLQRLGAIFLSLVVFVVCFDRPRSSLRDFIFPASSSPKKNLWEDDGRTDWYWNDEDTYRSDPLALLFMAFAFAVVVKLIRKAAATASTNRPRRGYQVNDFDAILEQMALQVMEDENEITDKSDLVKPLLSSFKQPPSCGVCRLEDKMHGISDRKTGEGFREGFHVPCVLRVTFLDSDMQPSNHAGTQHLASEGQQDATTSLPQTTTAKSHGWFIQGSRTYIIPAGDVVSVVAVHNFQIHSHHPFVIKKGWVSSISGKAFWEEANDAGIRRVVIGQFDANFTSFSGEWLSTEATRGVLIPSVHHGNCDSSSSDGKGLAID